MKSSASEPGLISSNRKKIACNRFLMIIMLVVWQDTIIDFYKLLYTYTG